MKTSNRNRKGLVINWPDTKSFSFYTQILVIVEALIFDLLLNPKKQVAKLTTYINEDGEETPIDVLNCIDPDDDGEFICLHVGKDIEILSRVGFDAPSKSAQLFLIQDLHTGKINWIEGRPQEYDQPAEDWELGL